MYTATLFVHSWLRWVVILLGLLALVRAATGGTRAWTAGEDRGLLLLTIALDVQVLLGLLLYAWLSPTTRSAFENIGAAMRNPQLRFFVVEHLTGMIAAV